MSQTEENKYNKTSELQIGIVFWTPIALSSFLYLCFHDYGFSGADIIKSALWMWCFSWFAALRWHFKNNISQIQLIIFDTISSSFAPLMLQHGTNWNFWYWVLCICLLVNVLRFICRAQPEYIHR
jgi:hypothetical protein